MIPRSAVPAAFLAALTLAACGGDSDSGDSPDGSPAGGLQSENAPSIDPEAFADADPDDVEVIRGWTDALRDGNIEEAASFFALPSVAENGAVLIQISTEADARDFNSLLPCGAHLIGAARRQTIETGSSPATLRPFSKGRRHSSSSTSL